MKAVIKERAWTVWLTACARRYGPSGIFYQTLDAQPDQNRVLLRLRDQSEVG